MLSKVPAAQERAGFMSVQSAVQHMAGALGAIASSQFLSDGPGGSLLGVPALAMTSIALAFLTPPLVFAVERLLRQRVPG